MVLIKVNLSELPMEILEKIVTELNPDEVVTSVSKISKKFAEVAYRVMSKEFRQLEPMIEEQLSATRAKIMSLPNDPDSPEREMIENGNFTFLQILKSEYNIICAVFFIQRSINQSPMVFKAVKSLKEFQRLLKQSAENGINLKEDNVSNIMDNLRNVNSDLLGYFFLKTWNLEKDFLGLLTLNILNCSVCSNYNLNISFDQNPKSKSTKCYIRGNYEIVDLSNTLLSPPIGLQQMPTQEAKRVLAAYICDSIRWGNLFHTLRLRWICMDKINAMGRRQYPGWPLLDPKNMYVSGPPQLVVREESKELRNGDIKVIRSIEKKMEQMNVPDSWVGTRVDFQLWCLAIDAPQEFFSDEYWMKLEELPDVEEEEFSTRVAPYKFMMEYKAYIVAQSTTSQGTVESTIWLQDTQDATKIVQSRQLITT